MDESPFHDAWVDVGDIASLWSTLPDLHLMAEYLYGIGNAAAAEEVLRFALAAETAKARLERKGRKLAPLLKVVEDYARGEAQKNDIDVAHQVMLLSEDEKL
jgi:hypothetical protein